MSKETDLPTTQTQPANVVTFRSVALALMIGAVGGTIFTYFHIPLGWMMGAMTFNTAAAIAGLPVALYPRLRTLMVIVLGVMIGSAFTPDIIDRMEEWVFTILLLFGFLLVGGLMTQLFFEKAVKMDRVTAYFSAAPGGLSEMVLVGGAMGGDERTISLIHATRILLVVLTVPFLIRWMTGVDAATPLPHPSLELADITLLTGSGLLGLVGARLVGLPAHALTGPMIASAAIHLSGLTASQPPETVTAIAQVVIGTALGCRFTGTAPRLVLRLMVVAAVSTVILMSAALATAWIAWGWIGMPVPAMVLALAPGGVAEMSLTALALKIDTAFVSTHHVIRLFAVITLAPVLFRLLGRLPGRAPGKQP